MISERSDENQVKQNWFYNSKVYNHEPENETFKSDFAGFRDMLTKSDIWSSVLLHDSQVQRGQPRVLRGAELRGVWEVLTLWVRVATWQAEMNQKSNFDFPRKYFFLVIYL